MHVHVVCTCTCADARDLVRRHLRYDVLFVPEMNLRPDRHPVCELPTYDSTALFSSGVTGEGLIAGPCPFSAYTVQDGGIRLKCDVCVH